VAWPARWSVTVGTRPHRAARGAGTNPAPRPLPVLADQCPDAGATPLDGRGASQIAVAATSITTAETMNK